MRFSNDTAFKKSVGDNPPGRPIGRIGLYECRICKNMFCTFKDMRVHIEHPDHRTTHRVMFACNSCKKLFVIKQALVQHDCCINKSSQQDAAQKSANAGLEPMEASLRYEDSEIMSLISKTAFDSVSRDREGVERDDFQKHQHQEEE
jgi:hypothetical protein